MAITTTDDVKSWLGLDTTDYDTKIDALIPVVEADYLRIRNVDFAVDTDLNTEYPTGSAITAAEMVGYKLQNRNNFDIDKKETGAVNSESFSTYAVSYNATGLQAEKMLFGYPLDIVGSIKRYVRMA